MDHQGQRRWVTRSAGREARPSSVDLHWRDPLRTDRERTRQSSSSANGVPLPEFLAAPLDFVAVRRELELDRLDAAIKAVAAGGRREMVFVGGSAGAGKSTLVAEAAQRADGAGMTVLGGRCDGPPQLPYQPFREAINHYVAHAEQELLSSHVSTHGAALARLVPRLLRRRSNFDGQRERNADTDGHRLHRATTDLFRGATEKRPVLLVLEDFEVADASSVHLLGHLVNQSNEQSLLIIVTYRPEELNSSHPFGGALADWRGRDGASSIRLRGLDDLGVLALLEATAGHEFGDDLVGFAHDLSRDTRGNPLFVWQALRHLSECGVLGGENAARWHVNREKAHLVLLESLRQVIGARVSRLGAAFTSILSVAAVIGRRVDVECLRQVAGLDRSDLHSFLDRADDAGHLDGDGQRYRFSHAAIRQTLYDDLTPIRRRRLHLRVAETFEARSDDHSGERDFAIAHHRLSALPLGDLQRLGTSLRRANKTALCQLAPADAEQYLSHARDLL